MFATYVVVTVFTIAANAFEAVASIAPARFMLANAAEVGVPRSWLRTLGVLKGAGALGLLAGLVGAFGLSDVLGFPLLRWIGIAAGIGLVLFFIGAITAHVRARVFHNIAFPASFLVLAAASLGLLLAV